MTKPEYMKYRDLRLLIFELIDSSITQERMAELNQILANDPDAVDYYVSFLDIQMLTKSFMSESFAESFLCLPPDENIELQELWKDLNQIDNREPDAGGMKPSIASNISLRGADLGGFNLDADTDGSDESGLPQNILEILDLERTSPAVEIPKEEPKRELIQKVESDFKWFPGRPSKRKTRTLLAIAASIIVTIGYMYFFGPKYVYRPVVATLSDSIEAAWDKDFQKPDEFGDMVQSRYRLNKGYAEILLSDGASVTVEAPAELALNSGGDIELFSGRIYAVVPQQAKGFSVKAGSSKIVDLGTEFGVELDNTGNTQLHVTKGRTMLFAGLLGGIKSQVNVDAGSAKKVYNDGYIKDIAVAERKFVRRIDSSADLVFRNIKSLNLVDVIDGENGLGPGRDGYGISIKTGKFGILNPENIALKTGNYKLVESDFIDGIFSPYPADGPVKISSQGHIFTKCPPTSGYGSNFINVTTFFNIDGEYKKEADKKMSSGQLEKDVSIHSNAGITFCLEQIQKKYSGTPAMSITGQFGLIKEALTGYLEYKKNNPKSSLKPPTVNFYVLVDGTIRYQLLKFAADSKAKDFEVELKPSDRFLTIIVTDDGESQYDWCVLANPKLNFK